ncbi:MAG: orotate phosphoribosyltransferase [Candidatus Aenigmarchaeota archaeon]|nr:orotate phosphoribosyltransferase [Candidatus Aenigmarchaeota archaeon]
MNEEISKILLKINAFSVNIKEPFKFVSGILSPIYLDCRRLISFPKERKIIINNAVNIVKKEVGLNNIDVIAGGETAGIPLAAWLADKLNMPMIYVRKEPKGYGKQKQTEGVLNRGQRVLLFEDMMTTGGSKLNFFNGIINDGGVMEHCLVIFEYGYEEARKTLKENNIQLHSMSNLDSVLKVGKAEGYFTDEEIKEVKEWFKDHDKWAEKFKK